ncbi:hypothetical protein [Bermanella sp. R86510]|uniref:hypothetical protein n=1 Tax=unclassified Bermanella TaxID=2627862 RepID=UPI0037C4F3F7
MDKFTDRTEASDDSKRLVYEAADQPTKADESNTSDLILPPYKATSDEIFVSIVVALLSSPIYGYLLYLIINGGTLSGRRVANYSRPVEVEPFNPYFIFLLLIIVLIHRRFLLVLACIPPRLILFLFIKPSYQITVWVFKTTWRIAIRLSKTQPSVAHLRMAGMVLYMLCSGLIKLLWWALGNPVGIIAVGLITAFSIYLMT